MCSSGTPYYIVVLDYYGFMMVNFCRMGGHYTSGGGLVPGHQAQLMRMLDMSSNGGGYPRQAPPISPQDGALLSTTSPLSSPRDSPPASTQPSLPPPPRPPPPGHLSLASPHSAPPKPDSSSYKAPGAGASALSSGSCYPTPASLPIFSSHSLPPDPFSALQDLRLSHPSISQWIQQQVSTNMKPEPVSPRHEQQPNILPQPQDYQRN